MARRDSRAGALPRCVALLAVMLVVGCRPEPAPPPAAAADSFGPPKRVLFITVDTLRADHLSTYGYARATSPHLDRWAATGRALRTRDRAVAEDRLVVRLDVHRPLSADDRSAAQRRDPGTGRDRDPAGVFPRAGLFDGGGRLQSGAHGAPGLERAASPSTSKPGAAATSPKSAAENRQLFAAHRVNALALPLLEKLKTADKFFLWLHYTDPHAPYILPPGTENPFLGDSFDRGADQVPRGEAAGRLIAKERRLPFYVAQYDANVLYVDGMIHQILERAQALGLLDGALVVVTSDHGESLGEHGSYFEHGPLAYNTTLHVPLVFALPGRGLQPARIPHPVELVDLYPTLRDLIAPAQAIAGLEGKSLVPFLGAELPEQATPELATRFQLAFGAAGKRAPYTHLRSVQDREWKLIYEPAHSGRGGRRGQLAAERFELYRLRTDPLETTNLATTETEEVRRLRRALFGWMKEDIWSGQDEATLAANDREVRQALKALGYIK